MSKKTLDEKILALWHNSNWKGSFTGIRTFQTLLKTDKNIDISEKKLYDILKTDSLYLKHLKPNRKINRRHYNLNYYGELIQGDLAFMFEDNGFNYFLVLIDCFTLKVFSYPLKQKTSSEVLLAFEKLIKKFNCEITKFECDQGTEFSKVKRFCEENKIIFKFKFGNNKANFAEWIIMVLKRRLYKILRDKQTQKWTKYLKIVCDQFNDTPQKKIGFLKPNQINNIYDTALKLNDNKDFEQSSFVTYKDQEKNQLDYESQKSLLQKNTYVYLNFQQKLFDKSFDIQVKMKRKFIIVK